MLAPFPLLASSSGGLTVIPRTLSKIKCYILFSDIHMYSNYTVFTVHVFFVCNAILNVKSQRKTYSEALVSFFGCGAREKGRKQV